MNRSLFALTLAALFAIVAPATATTWGLYYVSNDHFGHCGDGRLSPAIRISNCVTALQSHMLNRNGATEIFYELAAAYADESDYQDAAAVYGRALQTASNEDTIYLRYFRGMSYLYWGKEDIASSEFTQLAKDTNDGLAFAGLAEVSATEGRFLEAIKHYDEAIALRNADDDLRLARANVYARMGDYADAMSDDDAIVNDHHENQYIYNSRCWDRAISNRDLDAALSDCNRALDALPDTAWILDSRALVRFRLGQWDEAIADYDAALSHNPRFVSSLFMLGVSELRKGDKENGNADIAAAETIYPQIRAQYAVYGIAP